MMIKTYGIDHLLAIFKESGLDFVIIVFTFDIDSFVAEIID